MGVLLSITFSHTPDEARSVGLAKTCVPSKNLFCYRENKLQYRQLCLPVHHMHKASPPAQPMLPRDVPDGPWQEITADYLTHKGREYLLICNQFSKYPFLYKVSTKSAQSLCACLLELISQYGPPSLLFMDNGQPFASEELTQFL